MVPAVTKKGRSFKGAALYYLHDKDALTDERVTFTHTANLHTNDPHLATRLMAYTAMHQSDLKLAAGETAGGRKLAYPVYVYSLSWHPTEDPTHEEMLRAGLDSLKVNNLEEYEVVIVAHNDEPHPHLHIIVNRVHPETGIAAKLSNDRLRLSEWAEQYEREHGEIFCKRRVENNERRRKGEWVKDRERRTTAEYHKWRSEQSRQQVGRRLEQFKNLSDHHKKEQTALLERREHHIADRRVELRELNRPYWATLYKLQTQERIIFDQAQRTAFGRLRYYLKNRHRDPDLKGRNMLAGAFQAIASNANAAKNLEQKHDRQRKKLSDRVTVQTRNALKQINTDYDHDRDRLTTQQRIERAATKEALTLHSKKEARDLVSGRKREQFDRLDPDRYLPLRERQEQQHKDRPASKEIKKYFTHAAQDDHKKKDKDAKRKARFTAFTDLKDETTRDRKAERKKMDRDTKRKGRFSAFRDLKAETTRDREAERKKNDRDTKRKGRFSAFRDLKDETTRDRKGRDTGRKRGPKPPTPNNPS